MVGNRIYLHCCFACFSLLDLDGDLWRHVTLRKFCWFVQLGKDFMHRFPYVDAKLSNGNRVENRKWRMFDNAAANCRCNLQATASTPHNTPQNCYNLSWSKRVHEKDWPWWDWEKIYMDTKYGVNTTHYSMIVDDHSVRIIMIAFLRDTKSVNISKRCGIIDIIWYYVIHAYSVEISSAGVCLRMEFSSAALKFADLRYKKKPSKGLAALTNCLSSLSSTGLGFGCCKGVAGNPWFLGTFDIQWPAVCNVASTFVCLKWFMIEENTMLGWHC